jgi:hypothetical protein
MTELNNFLSFFQACAKGFLAQDRQPSPGSQGGQGCVGIRAGTNVNKIQAGFIQHCFKIIEGLGDVEAIDERVSPIGVPVTQGYDFRTFYPGPGGKLNFAPGARPNHPATPNFVSQLKYSFYS